MNYSEFIKTVLQKTSATAVHHFGRVTSSVKKGDNNQVLTETDIEIGTYIVSAIQKEFPSHNVIDEEAGVIDNKSEYTWVVDPIDGTSNFAAGLPMYGTMIGLLHNGVPIAGGIALPYFSEIIIAEKNTGAYVNGRRLQVCSEENLKNILVAYGVDGHQENPEKTEEECRTLARIILNIRNLRSTNSCYDGVCVAKGIYGGYMNKTSKIWDNVAQQIVIEESGGVYTDYFGMPIDYSNPVSKAEMNFTICAAPRSLHRRLQECIKGIK